MFENLVIYFRHKNSFQMGGVHFFLFLPSTASSMIGALSMIQRVVLGLHILPARFKCALCILLSYQGKQPVTQRKKPTLTTAALSLQKRVQEAANTDKPSPGKEFNKPYLYLSYNKVHHSQMVVVDIKWLYKSLSWSVAPIVQIEGIMQVLRRDLAF